MSIRPRTWVWIGGLAVVVIVVIALAIGYAFRARIAEDMIVGALRDQGFPDASVRVDAMGFAGATVADVVLDPDLGTTVGRIDVSYSVGELTEGRLRGVVVDGVRLTLDLTGEKPLLGPLQPLIEGDAGDEAPDKTAGETGGAPPALPPIEIRDARITALTSAGPAEAKLDGALEIRPDGGLGGRFEVALDSDPATLDGSVKIDQGPDGTVEAQLAIDGGRVSLPEAQVAGLQGRASARLVDQKPVDAALDLTFDALGLGEVDLGRGSVAGGLEGTQAKAQIRLAPDSGVHGLSLALKADDPFGVPKVELAADARVAHASTLWRLSPYPAPTAGEVVVALKVEGPLGELSPPAGLDAAVARFLADGWKGSGRLELSAVDYPGIGSGFAGALDFALGSSPQGLQLSLPEGAGVTVAAIARSLLSGWKIPTWISAVVDRGAEFRLRGLDGGPLHLTIAAEETTMAVYGDLSADLVPNVGRVHAKAMGASMTLDDFDLSFLSLPVLDVEMWDVSIAGQTIAEAHFSGVTDITERGELVRGTLSARAPRLAQGDDEAIDVSVEAEMELVELDLAIDIRSLSPARLAAASARPPGPLDLEAPFAIEIPEAQLHIAPDDTIRFESALAPGPMSWRVEDDDDGMVMTSDLTELRAAGVLLPDDTLAGVLRFAGLNLEVPAHKLAVENVNGSVNLEPESEAPVAQVTIQSLRHMEGIAAFAPISLDGEAYRKPDAFEFEARATVGAARSPLTLKGRHEIESEVGEATVSMPTITFGSSLQPKDLLPVLSDLQNVSGQIDGGARIRWQGADLKSSGRLKLSDLDFVVDGTSVQGVNGTINLSSLAPPRAPAGQELTARLVDPGLPLENMTVRLGVRGTRRGGVAIPIERLDADTLGGTLTIADAMIEPASARNSVNVQLTNLDLGVLLERVDLEGLTGSGRLSGVLPITLEDGVVTVQEGSLAAQEPGSLSYRSTTAEQALKAGGEQVDLMMRALSDFRYTDLSTGVDMDSLGYLRLSLGMEGNNPEVLDGYPFRFNINLEGNATPFLEALSESGRISGSLLSREWLLGQ